MTILALDDPVVVVGGGPAGLIYASSNRKDNITVVEQARKPGFPPHCTGIVSPTTASGIGVKEAIENEYKCAIFVDGRFREKCRICRNPLAVRLNRPLLEELLMQRVENLGHQLLLGERAEKINTSSSLVITRTGRRLHYRLLVLADGITGFLSRKIRGEKCDTLYGIEARIELSKRLGSEEFYTIHDAKLSPHFFAWIIPLSNGREAVVGLAAGETVLERIALLLSIIDRRHGVRKIISRRSGLVARGPPIENPVPRHNIVLIGDATCASKPFTGGGLYSALHSARKLANTLAKGSLKEYRSWWKRFRRELVDQRTATKLAHLLGPLFWPIMGTACKLCANNIDFDLHTRIPECLATRL